MLLELKISGVFFGYKIQTIPSKVNYTFEFKPYLTMIELVHNKITNKIFDTKIAAHIMIYSILGTYF